MAAMLEVQKSRLVRHLSFHYTRLFKRSMNPVEVDYRTTTWNVIVEDVNSLGYTKTLDQWKKVWAKMKKTANDKILFIQQYRQRTGSLLNCPIILSTYEKSIIKITNNGLTQDDLLKQMPTSTNSTSNFDTADDDVRRIDLSPRHETGPTMRSEEQSESRKFSVACTGEKTRLEHTSSQGLAGLASQSISVEGSVASFDQTRSRSPHVTNQYEANSINPRVIRNPDSGHRPRIGHRSSSSHRTSHSRYRSSNRLHRPSNRLHRPSNRRHRSPDNRHRSLNRNNPSNHRYCKCVQDGARRCGTCLLPILGTSIRRKCDKILHVVQKCLTEVRSLREIMELDH